MNLRRSVMLLVVGVVAAAIGAGAGMVLKRGPVAETRVKSVGGAERFEWVDVFVSGEHAVGAWQVELKEVGGGGGAVAFVGVEGGGEGFEPPFYDSAALSGGERLVLGGIGEQMAKSQMGKEANGGAEGVGTKTSSPPGLAEPRPAPPLGAGGTKTRVARVHVRVSGSVEFAGALVALSDGEGKRIGGTIELVRGEAAQR